MPTRLSSLHITSRTDSSKRSTSSACRRHTPSQPPLTEPVAATISYSSGLSARNTSSGARSSEKSPGARHRRSLALRLPASLRQRGGARGGGV
jgi:hypothetical protein